VKETLNKLGIGQNSVSEGRFAEIDSPFRQYSPEERARVQDQMHATYELFVSRVAEARKSTPAKIDAIAQGRVWTGRQAQQLGLVDELGGLDAAIRLAKSRARIDTARDIQLVIYPARRTLVDLISNPFGRSLDETFLSLFRRPESRIIDAVAASLDLFRRGEPLTIMPNVFWTN
jgi:protease-4